MNGKIIGLIIGKELSKRLGPGLACMVIGAIFIIGTLAAGIGMVSKIMSGTSAYVRNYSLWSVDNGAKIVEIKDGMTIVEYSFPVGTHRAEVNSLQADTGRITLYYDPDDLSQVTTRLTGGWIRTSGRVAEFQEESVIVEYDVMESRTGVLRGKPRFGDDRAGRVVHVRYEIANPSKIARELVDFGDFMVLLMPLLFGGGFIALGMFVNKAIQKKAPQ
jgi:hypothetical protein